MPYEKISVIPNGFNPEGFCDEERKTLQRKDIGFTDQDFIFLNVSSFVWLKSHNTMLTALSELIKSYPQFKLILIGSIMDKPLYDDILNKITQEGLQDNVKIFNYVDRSLIKNYYELADCFLMPSIQEGWSLALMEAMYCSLPLIVTDIGSARDIIEDNDIGIIINNAYDDIVALNLLSIKNRSKENRANNLEMLKSAMVEMFNNKDIWKQRSTLGKDKIINNFTIEKMLARYEETFIETYRCMKL
ncbi:Glycosyl transferase, group 1 domain protein [Candidatus Magnetoovum chiemensis]|nr:Glycosyl transferase, group 1 domain protein [Candidatus Magnetoovum chiemensis]